METYTTSAIAKIFDVTPQTIKNYSRVFAEYLSPSARPEANRKRIFTTDDLRIFSLVHAYHLRGFGYEDALRALQSGQRGELPSSDTAITTKSAQGLEIMLRGEIAARDELIRSLTSERDMERGKVILLKEQLAEKEAEIERLKAEQNRK